MVSRRRLIIIITITTFHTILVLMLEPDPEEDAALPDAALPVPRRQAPPAPTGTIGYRGLGLAHRTLHRPHRRGCEECVGTAQREVWRDQPFITYSHSQRPFDAEVVKAWGRFVRDYWYRDWDRRGSLLQRALTARAVEDALIASRWERLVRRQRRAETIRLLCEIVGHLVQVVEVVIPKKRKVKAPKSSRFAVVAACAKGASGLLVSVGGVAARFTAAFLRNLVLGAVRNTFLRNSAAQALRELLRSSPLRNFSASSSVAGFVVAYLYQQLTPEALEQLASFLTSFLS